MNSIEEKKVSVAIIIDSEKRILLQKKDSGYLLGPNKWSLPGGQIEKDESGQEAAVRETKEELGIDFNKETKPFKKIIFEGNLNGKNLKVEHHVFIINFKGKLSEIRIGEGIGFAFFEKEELPNINMMMPTKQILEEYLQ